MTESTKATRASIQIGDLTVDGFMLPDGNYRMSQTQTAEAVGLPERNARDFLKSKAIKRLLGEDYTPAISEVEIESTDQARGQSRINALPLDTVSAYWLWQLFRGNKQALALCMALMIETLTRRFDKAFGVQRSEDEYNQLLRDQNAALQATLQDLADAYAEPDLLREHVSRLEQQIRSLGAEPWDLPNDGGE
ncbi:hypothetical protein N836_09550 [Leptolyngbya sp. Heron Island J]|uniref:hypothetical protein n=1 Tax=Leptolyngbya sp. Heron Island J TaxID=1385935 RepID=UPI0003B99EB6|nr:hypothetical protein [Leptolyngbya sp. Heron Island J]ESA35954.1 hypothetical protein N836_09550 [Leptolyngbya sp. Heron Island J]